MPGEPVQGEQPHRTGRAVAVHVQAGHVSIVPVRLSPIIDRADLSDPRGVIPLCLSTGARKPARCSIPIYGGSCACSAGRAPARVRC